MSYNNGHMPEGYGRHTTVPSRSWGGFLCDLMVGTLDIICEIFRISILVRSMTNPESITPMDSLSYSVLSDH